MLYYFSFQVMWSVGSVGRAHRSHRWGHWFESSTDHQVKPCRQKCLQGFFVHIDGGFILPPAVRDFRQNETVRVQYRPPCKTLQAEMLARFFSFTSMEVSFCRPLCGISGKMKRFVSGTDHHLAVDAQCALQLWVGVVPPFTSSYCSTLNVASPLSDGEAAFYFFQEIFLMPKTKPQSLFFTAWMMVCGITLYNFVLATGRFTNASFLLALKDMWFEFVVIFFCACFISSPEGFFRAAAHQRNAAVLIFRDFACPSKSNTWPRNHTSCARSYRIHLINPPSFYPFCTFHLDSPLQNAV